jgi:hypothetical protein
VALLASLPSDLQHTATQYAQAFADAAPASGLSPADLTAALQHLQDAASSAVAAALSTVASAGAGLLARACAACVQLSSATVASGASAAAAAAHVPAARASAANLTAASAGAGAAARNGPTAVGTPGLAPAVTRARARVAACKAVPTAVASAYGLTEAFHRDDAAGVAAHTQRALAALEDAVVAAELAALPGAVASCLAAAVEQALAWCEAHRAGLGGDADSGPVDVDDPQVAVALATTLEVRRASTWGKCVCVCVWGGGGGLRRWCAV